MADRDEQNRTPDEADVPSNEELARRPTERWQAEDAQDSEDNADPASQVRTEDDEALEAAQDALQDMAARERRRDSTYRSGGDDYNDGIDEELDTNAPKDMELPRKKRGGSRGQSDWN